MNYKYLIQNGTMRRESECILYCQKPHIHSNINSISGLSELNNLIPVGSVEFTKEFSKLIGIRLPENMTYPKELYPFLKRKLWQDKFSNVNENLFVKPVKTKTFTGAIKKSITEPVNPNEEVWVSDTIDIEAEFRYYVLNGKVVGHSRYDDGDNEIESDKNIVQQIINEFKNQPSGYTIDIGISKEEAFLIEINDGWALGYYPWGNCSKQSYLELITERWKEILRINKEEIKRNRKKK